MLQVSSALEQRVLGIYKQAVQILLFLIRNVPSGMVSWQIPRYHESLSARQVQSHTSLVLRRL